ncbi:hypothetical protein JHK82_014393 [Glycine max]|uniref:Uncharacterized protein n=2 Tax=Glycine subgen. Soja TaxID=1462606 RepID=A0A0R0JHB6_SOYBN|nr:hypothetical protein JHK87_014304 [Glycine soja]KAG5030787.1 hypothetical protein JHK85_014769 [Glycine max]KAG5045015.1 hypothetical protein JHK86_014421 [Glycine max]KAG5147512.1 hypothetical protein JHK82_014393 [Glycine max]KAH1124213.1 hypothetical protein GYH30_014106 [Glycine max]
MVFGMLKHSAIIYKWGLLLALLTTNFVIDTTKLCEIPLLLPHLIVLTPFPFLHPNLTSSTPLSQPWLWGLLGWIYVSCV